jgi:hypothetical protein
VELEAILATKVKKCLLSGIRFREGGYSVVLNGSGSYVEKGAKKLSLMRDGKRDVVNLTICKKENQVNAVTVEGLQREIAKVKTEMRAMSTGLAPGIEDEAKCFTEEEQRPHVRSNHVVCDARCELCVQTRGLARHPKQVETESVNFDSATVKNAEGTQTRTLLIGGGPRGETFARRAPRKGDKFLEAMKNRYGQILCVSDQGECLVQVVRPVALKLGLPTGDSPVERPQANGRAEQRVRSTKERLRFIVAEMRKAGVEFSESPT